jgi:hypothetical protein
MVFDFRRNYLDNLGGFENGIFTRNKNRRRRRARILGLENFSSIPPALGKFATGQGAATA